MSHTIVHSAENGDRQATAHLLTLRMASLARPPLPLRIQVSRFHILPTGLFTLAGSFQVFNSLHTKAEMTPKIRPRPLPSAFFPIHYSLITQPQDAVKEHELILIKFFGCLFNDAVGSRDYTRAMAG